MKKLLQLSRLGYSVNIHSFANGSCDIRMIYEKTKTHWTRCVEKMKDIENEKNFEQLLDFGVAEIERANLQNTKTKSEERNGI